MYLGVVCARIAEAQHVPVAAQDGPGVGCEVPTSDGEGALAEEAIANFVA